MTKQNIPVEALWFRAGVAFQSQGESRTRLFEGVAYSGNALNHWFWDRVVFDLASTSFAPKIPALIDHDRSRRAGVASLSIDGGRLVASGSLLSNGHGSEVATDADEGFPWQMSVHIEPGSIEKFEAGQDVTVNDQQLTGPIHIFRNNQIREVSFTPTGVDGDTSARVMSGGKERSIIIKEHAVVGQHNEDLQAQITQLKEQVTGLQASVDAERQRADQADKALADALKASREAEISALEKDTGKQFSAEDKEMMAGLDTQAFQFMAAQLKTAKPNLPGQLFMHPGAADLAQAVTNPLLEDAKRRYAQGAQ
jgi:hypothetical protein